MDITNTGDSAPLQTVEDALEGAGLEALQRWAEQSDQPVQEAPKPEAPAETPEQPAAEETNDLSQSTPEETPEDETVESDMPEATKARVQKRIDQLSAKAKAESERAAAAQAELEQTKARQAELEARLQELENAPPQQQAKPPIVPETQKLLDAENEQARLGKIARELLRKLEVTPDETLELMRSKLGRSFDSVMDARWYLEDAREEATEKLKETKRQRELAEDKVRRQIEAKVAEVRKQAIKLYPWLEKPGAEQQAVINQLRKEFNGIENAPLQLARLVAAELAERKPAAAPIIAPKVPTAGKVPATTRTNGKPDTSHLKQRLIESEGKEEDLTNFFTARS